MAASDNNDRLDVVAEDEEQADEQSAQSLRELLTKTIAELDPPPRSFELRWVVQHTLPRSTERRVIPLIVDAGAYGVLRPEKWDRVSSHIRRGHFQIQVEQARSLYAQHLAEKALTRHAAFVKLVPQLVQQYDRGTSVLTLSRTADVTPVTVMREILKRRWKCRNQDIKAALDEDSQLFNARDRSELRLAEANDIVANIDKSAHQQKAAEFEERVLGYFSRTLGIRCQSESELQAMQVRLFNKQLATPDVLFLDRVVINGMEVHWIDAKDMYGSRVGLTAKRLRIQAQKYLKEFGPGAFLFSRSFCHELHMENVLFLEPSSIPELAAAL